MATRLYYLPDLEEYGWHNDYQLFEQYYTREGDNIIRVGMFSHEVTLMLWDLNTGYNKQFVLIDYIDNLLKPTQNELRMLSLSTGIDMKHFEHLNKVCICLLKYHDISYELS